MTSNSQPVGSQPVGSQPVGSQIYSDFAKEQLDAEVQRKTSLEQRGLAVVTTSGALVTLVFGLTALSTQGQQTYEPPPGFNSLVATALAWFIAAAFLALLTNAPLPGYAGVRPSDLLSALRANWNDNESDARARATVTRLNILEAAVRMNNIKAYLLILSILFEVVAVVFVALAVRKILG